jgi:hypothetical protein
VKVLCKHCGSKVRVTHSKQIFPDRREVYGNCLNPECAARMNFELKYHYDIVAPKQKLLYFMAKCLAELSPEDREQLLKKHAI